MSDLLLFLLGMGVIAAVVVLATRYVGLGQCLDCGQRTLPWSAYCHAHSPFGGGPGA